MATPEGWYHAEGDPPGTVRYWNGSEWVGPPVSSPAAGQPAPPEARGYAPVESGVTLSRLVSPSGRINRVTFLVFNVSVFVIGLVLSIVDFAAGTFDEDIGYGLFLIVGLLVLLWPSIATSVKRFHDFGASGWWVLISLIPFVGFIVLVLLLVYPGNAAPNRHGGQPAPGVAF